MRSDPPIRFFYLCFEDIGRRCHFAQFGLCGILNTRGREPKMGSWLHDAKNFLVLWSRRSNAGAHSEQIQKFVMEGSLKVEARIFNSDANQWCVAADLFPQFGLGQPQPGQKGWQPPPRPSSINKHVVSESGDEPSALIDYFELLGVAKKTNYIPSPQANKHAASVSEKLSSKASEINLTEGTHFRFWSFQEYRHVLCSN